MEQDLIKQLQPSYYLCQIDRGLAQSVQHQNNILIDQNLQQSIQLKYQQFEDFQKETNLKQSITKSERKKSRLTNEQKIKIRKIKQRQKQIHFSKTYDNNFYCPSQAQTLQTDLIDQNKTFSGTKNVLSKAKKQQFGSIAIRFAMYNQKCKNPFLQALKAASKREKKIKDSTKQYQQKIKNKYNQNETGFNFKQDLIIQRKIQNVQLLLNKREDVKNNKKYKKQISSAVIDRNKNNILNSPSNKSNNAKKFHFYVHEQYPGDLKQIKSKLDKNKISMKDTIKIKNNQIDNKITHLNLQMASQNNLIKIKENRDKHNNNRPVPINLENKQKQKTLIETKKQDYQSKFFKKSLRSTFSANLPQRNHQNQNPMFIKPSIDVRNSKNIQLNLYDTSNLIPVPLKTVSKKIQKIQIPLKKALTKDIRQSEQTNSNNKTQLSKAKNSQVQKMSDGPIFIFDSKDHTYISSYLKQNNWRQYHTKADNSIVCLKWVNNPVYSQILNLKQGQYYNHFHKSFQLTSKSFLNSNLKTNQHFVYTRQFFPECYDIGNETERKEFIEAFNYKTLMILLQNTIKYCIQNQKNSFSIITYLNKFEQTEQIQHLIQDSQIDQRLQNQYFNVMEFQDYKKKDDQFLLNIFLITQALKYYRKQRKKYDIDFRKDMKNALRFISKQFQQNYTLIEIYSKQKCLGQPNSSIGLMKEYYATPSQLLLKILARQYVFFHKINRWKYNFNDKNINQSNIWIVKPSSNARGNGIYLQTNLNAILKSAKQIQSRIVQKYIQYPLLFKKTKYSYLNYHKFDLRQWVLLKSLDPLEIYMFSSFYIRLASQKYSIYPINNSNIHLTNFSSNKKKFKSNEHSIVNSEDFIQFLKVQHNVQWEKNILPQIKSIIIKSIQACQQKLQNSPNGTCFQLLGYDILLDQKFTPWLLQVNMSPACEQRGEWLSGYLKDMNQGLLQIVLPQQKLPMKNKVLSKQYKWINICSQDYHSMNKDCDQKLQVISSNLIKNKPVKQVQTMRSKSSFEMFASPTKFRRNTSTRKSRYEKSIKKQKDQKRKSVEQKYDQQCQFQGESISFMSPGVENQYSVYGDKSIYQMEDIQNWNQSFQPQSYCLQQNYCLDQQKYQLYQSNYQMKKQIVDIFLQENSQKSFERQLQEAKLYEANKQEKFIQFQQIKSIKVSEKVKIVQIINERQFIPENQQQIQNFQLRHVNSS